jgi:hypothetical protein
MRLHSCLSLACTPLFLFAVAAHAQGPVVSAAPKELHRGDSLTLTIANPPPDIVYAKAIVKRYRPELDAELQKKIVAQEIPLVAAEGGYTASIARNLLYGTYDIVAIQTADAKNKIDLSSAEHAFTIVPAAAPYIDSVDPAVTYPEDKYQLTVSGSNFSSVKADNALQFVSKRPIPMCDDIVKTNCISVIASSGDGRQVVFGNIDRQLVEKLVGPQKIRVRVGTLPSEEEAIPITVSKVERSTPLHLAAAITAGILLVLVVVLLMARSKTPGRPYSLLAMAFLDTETNTYSLSKAQFYAWTFVAVFGYFFLTLAKWLVQGVFELADVPQNLPGIILVSAGTATLATGIGGARPKGSGAPKPSLGDFVTSGGVVAPDRVQFLVWTIVGIVSFIGLLMQSEPGTIRELPKIPEGFLYIMGISSAGYLGGKLARKPGPNVSSATGTPNAAAKTYEVDVVGRNLSPDAFLYMDDVRVPATWLTKNSAGAAAPEVVAYEEDHQFAKELKYTIQNATFDAQTKKITFSTGSADEKFRLAIVNPDGQRSEYQMV